MIKLHETCRIWHNSSEQKDCFRIYFTDYANKICINQKGFGQGMGTTNAQKPGEVNLVWGWNGKFVRKSNEFKACLEG